MAAAYAQLDADPALHADVSRLAHLVSLSAVARARRKRDLWCL